MALWSASANSRVDSNVTVGSTAITTTITGSATPHVKGSWSQLIASTGFDSSYMIITNMGATGFGTLDTSILLDIGIGGSGSEVPVLSDLPHGHLIWGQDLIVPLRMPAGSRVSARLQSAVASKTSTLNLTLVNQGYWADQFTGSRATTYGTNSGVSNGTTLTDVGTANTKSSWTPITTSTTNPIKFLLPVLGVIPADTNLVGTNYLFDIGISTVPEVVILANISAAMTSNEDIKHPSLVAIPVNLPPGVRLSARFQKGNSTGHQPTMAIIGID